MRSASGSSMKEDTASKQRKENPHFSPLQGCQFLGKRKPYERICELFNVLYATTDWKQKKWQQHSVVLLFSWREWCTLQNQLHRGEGEQCGYIKARSQDVKSSVTNGCSPCSMITPAAILRRRSEMD